MKHSLFFWQFCLLCPLQYSSGFRMECFMSQIASVLHFFNWFRESTLSPRYLYTERVQILCYWEYSSVLFVAEHLNGSWAKSSVSRPGVFSSRWCSAIEFQSCWLFQCLQLSVCCHRRSVVPLSRQTVQFSLVYHGEGTYEGRLRLV